GVANTWGVATVTREPGAAARPVWTVPVAMAGAQRDIPRFDPNATVGSWLYDGLVVRGGVDGVVAYRTAHGDQAWTLPIPGGSDLCAMSPGAPGGVGLVALGPGGHCRRLVAVDAAPGRQLWTDTRLLAGASPGLDR